MGVNASQSAPEDIMPIAHRSTRSAVEKALLLKRKLVSLGAKRGTIAAYELKDGRPFEFFGRATNPFEQGDLATVVGFENGHYLIRIKETGSTWLVSSRSHIWVRPLTEEEAEVALWADSREREIDDIRTTFEGLEISSCLSAISSTDSDLKRIPMTASERRQATWRLEAFKGLLEDAQEAERARIAALSDEELDEEQHRASTEAVTLMNRVTSHHHDMRYWGKRGGEIGQRNAIKYAQFAHTADCQREQACITFDFTVIEKNRREEQARTDEISQAASITPETELASADDHALKCISVLNFLGEVRGLNFSTRALARKVTSIIIREWSVHRALVRSSLVLDHEFILRINEYSAYELCRLLAKIEIMFGVSGLGLGGLDAEWLERHKNVL